MTTVGDFKNSLVEGLFATLLNSRLDELTNSATPPLLYGYSYYGGTLQEPKRISICGDVTRG
jgi:zinc protease